MAGADLVVLAADPLTCLDLLDDRGRNLPGAGPRSPMSPAPSRRSSIAPTSATWHSSAATRWPAARSTGYGASRADLFLGRPWVLCPGASARPIDLERVEAAGQSACGAEVHWLAAQRARPGCRRDQPPAPGPRRRARRQRQPRPGLAHRPGPRRGRLAERDPPGPGRRDDGRRDRGHERARAGPPDPRSSAPSSTTGWPTSRRRPTIRPRPPSGSRRAWRRPARTARARAMSEQRPGRASRTRSCPGAGWRGIRTHDLAGVLETIARSRVASSRAPRSRPIRAGSR
jgi:hypothetical protein